MAGRGIPGMSSSSKTDPVLDLLTDLVRVKPKLPDKTKIEKARRRYNEMVVELETLRSQEVKGKEGVSDHGSKSQESLQKLRYENQKLRIELNSIKLRLSEVMGDKIIANNPDIADLSDPHRPIALAEKFQHVYDEEWVNAFENLERLNITEQRNLEFLANIIRHANTCCGTALEQMTGRIADLALNDITHVRIELEGQIMAAENVSDCSKSDLDYSKRLIKRYVKDLCHLSVRGIKELFDTVYLKPMLRGLELNGNHNGINSYVEKVMEYLWRMHLTDPPMVLKWQERGTDVSKDLSRFYTKSGLKVKQPVWPTVLLHEGGQVVLKGVVDVI